MRHGRGFGPPWAAGGGPPWAGGGPPWAGGGGGPRGGGGPPWAGGGPPWRGFGFNPMSRGRRHGRGPWGGPPGGFGPGGGFGPPGFGPGGFGPRHRMRRGDVRAALLVLLDEGPRNGYGLMQEIEQRSDGMWRPSPGSVYPALQQLEDEGLVRATEAEGRKAYELTAEGSAYVEERREQLGEPWAGPAESVGEDVLDLRQLMQGLGAALMQVAQTGDESQIARASKVMKDARTAIYRILSDEDPKD